MVDKQTISMYKWMCIDFSSQEFLVWASKHIITVSSHDSLNPYSTDVCFLKNVSIIKLSCCNHLALFSYTFF